MPSIAGFVHGVRQHFGGLVRNLGFDVVALAQQLGSGSLGDLFSLLCL